jgi:hypothetical protein
VNRPISAIRLAIPLLALAALAFAVGSALAAGGPPSLTAGPGDGPADPGARTSPLHDLTAVDLTRHTTTLVDGVPGTRGSVGVRCPDGVVVGGGFSHVSSGLRITESRPDGIHVWQVSWTQTSTDDTALYAYAVCMTSA